MQFKRPINTQTRDGIPVKVNSFQFLRASKLVLSVKASELVDGWQIPPEVMTRVKGEPLTEEELADWKAWKAKLDSNELVDSNIERLRTAVESAPDILKDAASALDHKLMIPTESDTELLWDAIDDLMRALKRAGLDRPKRPRGRPKAKRVIYADDESAITWPPNFYPPGSADHARYEALLLSLGKKVGDPISGDPA